MTTVLLIGEKTSQMKRFRDSLFFSSNSKTIKEANMIYSYRGNWTGSKATYDIILLPLTGHISSLDTPKAFAWGAVAPITIVQNPNALQVSYNSTYQKIIQKYAKQVQELWIATDPDSEGDNIGFEAYTLAIKANPQLFQRTRRIWNSSLTIAEIKRAVGVAEANPYGWDTNLALSVQGRRLADAWLGFAGTRELTESARKVKRVKVISVGRVQLPTLKMIVDRDIEHESHVPENLYSIQATLQKNLSEIKFTAKHHNSPVKDEERALKLFNRLKEEKTAVVKKIDKKNVRKKPPIPLNTTAAISLISRLHKIKADFALNVLSQLYLEGLISYPRTENTYFKYDFPHQDVLKKLQTHSSLGVFIKKLGHNPVIKTNGLKKGVEDHDPIHPTGELPKTNQTSKLQQIHIKVWETLVRYYISLFMNDLVTEKTKIDLHIKNELFISEGTILVDRGWTEICPWVDQDEKLLPTLIPEETVPIVEMNNIVSKTRPKPRWKEYTVIKQMERLKLGTKSSRAEILKVLSERNYVIRNSRHELISTDIGRTLINILKPIWPDIVEPNFTRQVENQMDLVATGKKKYNELLDDLRATYLSAHLALLPNLKKFEKSFKNINISIFPSQNQSVSRSKGSQKSFVKTNSSKRANNPLDKTKIGKNCPDCKTGTLMKRKNSMKGNEFFGCSNYPNCRYTTPLTKKRSPLPKKLSKKPLKTEQRFTSSENNQKQVCPLCKIGEQRERINRATGTKFLGCSRYPDCKWTQSVS